MIRNGWFFGWGAVSGILMGAWLALAQIPTAPLPLADAAPIIVTPKADVTVISPEGVAAQVSETGRVTVTLQAVDEAALIEKIGHEIHAQNQRLLDANDGNRPLPKFARQ